MSELRKKTIVERVISLLEDGIPRFEHEILKELRLSHNQVSLTLLYWQGLIARSSSPFWLSLNGSKVKAYAYTSIKNSSKFLSWKFNGQELKAFFKSKKRKRRKTIGDLVLEVLHERGIALFADEILVEIRKRCGKPIHIRSLKNVLLKLYRTGKLSRLDKTKGWKFSRGYLYGLNQEQLVKRLEIADGDLSVYTEVEMGIIKNIENSVKRASDVRNELGFDKSLITWLSRKLGKESEYEVRTRGRGKNYQVELIKINKNLKGRGLIPWLRWIKVGGEIIFYDERLPFDEIKEKITRIAYWITEEGERRRKIGLEWEKYCAKLFSLLDKRNEWQIRVLEHKERWRGQSGKEFDHVYICTLGPKEFAIRVYIVIESKAGILTTQDVDEFWRKLINEPKFRNFEDGGIKVNVIPIIIIAKRAENIALEKCSRRGIRVIFKSSTEEVFDRLSEEPNKKDISANASID